MYTLAELCKELSISTATGRNWVKLKKLIPQGKRGAAYNFSDEYVENLKKSLQKGSTLLKSRRNKSFASGNFLYRSYVSDKSVNIKAAEELLSAYSEILKNIENENCSDQFNNAEETLLRALLASSAITLLPGPDNENSKSDEPALIRYLKSDLNIDEYSPFIDDILGDKSLFSDLLDKYPIPSIRFIYEPGEDILGLLYISLKMVDQRKKTGAYYTPNKVIKRLLGHLFEASLLSCGLEKTILDPCCGTGNFLLQLPPGIPRENIYGIDIDEISVYITRINLAMKYDRPDYEFFKEHIKIQDFLCENISRKYDIILGNPPWGGRFSDSQQLFLSQKFESGGANNIESFDVFTEKAVESLTEDGLLSYVLPESILNVRSHTAIRNYVLKNTTLSHLEYLGEVFDHVQCPSIILQLKKRPSSDEKGIDKFVIDSPKVFEDGRAYTIREKRKINAEIFDFLMPDEEYKLLSKMDMVPEKKTLLGNGIFALGIVTGSNKDMLKKRKSPLNEVILKGADIYKYAFSVPKCYIAFDRNKCQQCAPTEYYRAKEKLLYRFIGNRLVFSYDDKQTLSLNSCNILIPQIEGLSTKYILAILNCRATEFYYRKKFRSVKVLRSHLESLPIPYADEEMQNKIISIVDDIIAIADKDKKSSGDKEAIAKIYEELDQLCASLFSLNRDEYDLIKAEFENDNTFLPN